MIHSYCQPLFAHPRPSLLQVSHALSPPRAQVLPPMQTSLVVQPQFGFNRHVSTIPMPMPMPMPIGYAPSMGVQLSPVRGMPLSPVRGVPLSPVRGVPLSPVRGVQLSPLRGVPLSPPRGVPLSPPRGVPLSPLRGVPLSPPRGVHLSPPRAIRPPLFSSLAGSYHLHGSNVFTPFPLAPVAAPAQPFGTESAVFAPPPPVQVSFGAPQPKKKSQERQQPQQKPQPQQVGTPQVQYPPQKKNPKRDLESRFAEAIKRTKQIVDRYTKSGETDPSQEQAEQNQNQSPFQDKLRDQTGDEIEDLALEYEDGFVYRGQGIPPQTRQGFGVLADSNKNEIYIGFWVNNLYDGEGTLNNLEQVELEEPLDWNDMTSIQNGWSHYKGEFKEGKMHGAGELILSNNERYKGQFIEGMIDGEGEFYTADNTVVKGVWEQGLLVQVISQDNL